MSAVVAHLEKDKLPHPLTGQLLSVGGFLDHNHADLLPEDIHQCWRQELASHSYNTDAVVLSARTTQSIMAQLAADSRDARISPCLFSKASFDGLPDAYLQIAGQDIFRDDGVLYAKQLQRGGAKTKVRTFPAVPHAWWEFEALDEAEEFLPDLVKGVKWLLEQHRP